MPVHELYSKREKRKQTGEREDPYSAAMLPDTFCTQVIAIWKNAIGTTAPKSEIFWKNTLDTMAEERGEYWGHSIVPFKDCCILLRRSSVHEALDIIEHTLRQIDYIVRVFGKVDRRICGINLDPDMAIEKLNLRLRQHNFGLQYLNGVLHDESSPFIHDEVVKPAVLLLRSERFEGPLQEFSKAHHHQRQGDHKEAINEALKAFESTMKTICERRGWDCSGQGAKNLIGIMLENELIPKYLASHCNALRAVLESGLPTIRNKTSAHGQGSSPVDVEKHLAAYALHLCASNIVFLVEAHRTME